MACGTETVPPMLHAASPVYRSPERPVPATSQLSPTVFRPTGSDAPLADSARPTQLADAAPTEPAFGDDDLITGVSLTFHCLPLGGATAARGFEPFALP